MNKNCVVSTAHVHFHFCYLNLECALILVLLYYYSSIENAKLQHILIASHNLQQDANLHVMPMTNMKLSTPYINHLTTD